MIRNPLLCGARSLVAKAIYSKKQFVDGVVALDLQRVGKLRSDANLQYLYCGAQKTWGAGASVAAKWF